MSATWLTYYFWIYSGAVQLNPLFRWEKKMDDKQKKHQFIHVPSTEETEENKCLNENSENDGDDSVPLGLTGKAVCMQVCAMDDDFFL